MLRIRNGFNADPDPAFNLKADPNLIQGANQMRIHMDPNSGPVQTLPSIKVKNLT